MNIHQNTAFRIAVSRDQSLLFQSAFHELGSSGISAGAYAIARHKLIDDFRRRGRATTIPVEDAGLFVPDESAGVEAKLDIERGLAALPAATQSLIRDIKLREMSNAEAADARGMTETAVKVAVHRGLKKLAAVLRTQPEKRP